MRGGVIYFTLLYPFLDMKSAGLIATSVNYLWTLYAIMILSLYLIKSLNNQRISIYESFIGILLIIFAGNHELGIVIIIALFSIVCIIKIKRKQVRMPYIYIGLFTSLVMLTYIITAPGRKMRYIMECQKRIPGFENIALLDKLYLGIANIERVFISTPNTVFFISAVLIAILVYKKTYSYFKTMVSLMPIMIMLGYSVLSMQYFEFTKLFVTPDMTFFVQWNHYSVYLVLLYTFATIISFSFSVYWLLCDDINKFLHIMIVLAVGFVTAVVMGFSPTLYESGDRTLIYFYFAVIYTDVYCINYTKNFVSFKSSERNLLYSFALIWLIAGITHIFLRIN